MRTLTVPQFVFNLRYERPDAPTSAEVAKRQRFLTFFPEQEANLITYQDNPNCQCAREIVAAVEQQAKPEFVMSQVESEPIQLLRPFDAVGHVEEIEDSPEAWRGLARRFGPEFWQFRGMSVVRVPPPEPDPNADPYIGHGPPAWTLRIYFY